jgi:hypothetical protein
MQVRLYLKGHNEFDETLYIYDGEFDDPYTDELASMIVKKVYGYESIKDWYEDIEDHIHDNSEFYGLIEDKEEDEEE